MLPTSLLGWATLFGWVAGVVAVLWELNMRWKARRLPMPPQFTQLPLVGHGLIALKHAADDTVVDLMHNGIKDVNFETMSFRTFHQLWVIGCTSEHVEHMFGAKFGNYIKGPEINEAFHQVLGNSIFTTDGEAWKEHRRVSSHLFTAQQLRARMRSVFERRAKQVSGLLAEAAKAGGPVDIQPLFYCYTFDSINEIAFGRAVDSLGGDKTDRAFQAAFDRAQQRVAHRLLCPAFVWKVLRLLPFGPEVQMARDIKLVDDYLAGAIRDRMDGGEGDGDGQDLISLFTEACEREGVKYTEKQLRDLIMSFVIAGRDTTASLLVWTFYLLMQHDDVLSRLRDEMRACDGDYDGMQWAQAVLQESLRLYPSVPLEFKVSQGHDVLPCGTPVLPGMRVMYNPYSHLRNPKNYSDPDSFKPDRWMEKDGTCKPYDMKGFTYPAFNAGPRICLGRKMAILEAKVLLSQLFLDFDFKLEEGFRPTPKFTVVLASKNGLRVNLNSIVA